MICEKMNLSFLYDFQLNLYKEFCSYIAKCEIYGVNFRGEY